MFEKQKYYDYIQKLENSITWVYIIVLVLSVLFGIAAGGVALIITIPLGLLLAGSWTLASKIKVQDMRWKMDLWDYIKNKGA